MAPKTSAQIIDGPWKQATNPEIVSEVGTQKTDNNSLVDDNLSLVGEHGTPSPKNKDTDTTDTDNPTLPTNIDSLTDKELRAIGYEGEWQSWRDMKYGRCKKGGYVLHPAFNKFKSFLKIMGPKPDPTYTTDRIINKNPEYSPKNCRWASKKLQSWNKSNTVFLTNDKTGEKLPLIEWAKRLNKSVNTLRSRRKKKWPDMWVLFGKPDSSTHTPQIASNLWKEFIPTSPPNVVEQMYKDHRRCMSNESSRKETRELWLLRYCTRRLYLVDDEISKVHDPYRPNQYPVPSVHEEMHTAILSCIQRTVSYIQKKQEASTATSLIKEYRHRGCDDAERYLTVDNSKFIPVSVTRK